jgi:hypothetical protein
MFALKVFLLLVTTLRAFTVDSSLTNWVNQYDGQMDWSTGSNRMVTGFYSQHNNHKEDRVWKFYHGSASGGVRCHSKYWTSDYQNVWDGTLSFSCAENEAISGFQSRHDNGKEDRRWKIQCCKVTNVQLHDVGLTGYLNNWDGNLDFTCADDEVLIGVYSVHDNRREDRRWKARCAQLRPMGDFVISYSLSNWENFWDNALEFDAGTDGMITGLYSVHDNKREDRRWKFMYGSATGVDCHEQSWTGWKNSWDGGLSYTCPSNQVLHGIQSYHDNRREDRRWKFQCCRVSSGVSVQRKGWTGFLNDFDAQLSYRCPVADQAIIGVHSYHNNHREDRRWKVRCGELTRN